MQTRAEVYSQITEQSDLREIPAEFLSGMYRTIERTVRNDGTIRLDSVPYKVDWKLVGHKVLVFKDLEGQVCMTDPLDPLGRVVFLRKGARSTVYYDSKRKSEDRWQHRHSPKQTASNKLEALGDKRDRKDQEGWPAGEAEYPAKVDNIVTLQQDREKAEMDSPFREAEMQALEFRSVREARLWILEVGLQSSWGELSSETQQGINDMLQETLDRDVITTWCNSQRRRQASGS